MAESSNYFFSIDQQFHYHYREGEGEEEKKRHHNSPAECV